jgi:RNA-directed DNA polymerase
MTGVEKLTGATPYLGKHWKSIDWKKVQAEVRRLQMRIAKAVKEEKWSKVKSLQWILSHSFSAKVLAVKRVTTRKGARTPGVDGIIWNTPARKMRGALSLKRHGYKALPLRRTLIPKRNGKSRPLGIPCMSDRAMQALYLLCLEPISETFADPNSYGFRSYRACRDAIAQCFLALKGRYSARWILDADIKACFDWINHDWLLENIPMDNLILRQWLKSGFVQQKKLFPTTNGTPQGGVASPTLANMTLDGLEKTVKAVSSRRDKVNFIRYADDFIVTATSKDHLENIILPAIKAFLSTRGLVISEEKTRIVRIEQGFDFLGQNVRKYGDKLIIKPAKENIRSFKEKVKSIIVEGRGWNAESLISKLTPVIRGWANYHRNIQSSRTFSDVHRIIDCALFRWAKRSNSNKTPKWICQRFFGLSPKGRFSCMAKTDAGKTELMELLSPCDVSLVRYIKIRGNSNPFDSDNSDYFAMRRKAKNYRPLDTNNFTAGLSLNKGLLGA